MARASNIERLGAADAMLRARGNELRRYPSPERDGDRLYPLASPTANPSFTIEEDDTIYAIGSCFARNVEKALEEAGKRVLSREFELGQVGESLGDAANFFNKYSIHSVTNEIRWALERETFPGEDIIYPMGKGRYCDPQLGMARLDFTMEQILEFRHRYLDAVASVAEADVIILTLGYVETWYDRKLDLYLNVIPPAPVIRAEPDRFEFRVLSYGDVLDGLNDLYALLNRHRTKPLKMLVTVSPVPLLSTFRDMDILVANAYSKSVQRAALDEFLLDKQGVDYFPSYEFVTLSNPTIAWSRNDFRHVSSDVVKRIMSNVITRYIGGDAAAPLTAENEITKDGLVSSLKLLHKLEKFDDVLVMVEQHRDLADSSEDVLMLEATAARRLDDLDHSFAALRKASVVAPKKPQALERMIMLCRPMRRKDDARELLGMHEKSFPGRADFREKVTWI
ncbi:GSCFA domain-containing protein [Ponticoccus sp. SC2-23]|uniref:GSCFA domain-containing protein n=1 Tax=Alexandriicola marinus TaxID=2081710 RepID=UPI000FD7C473|nr:GSCFA domain-containing protein [Alexandriicola marinus]MBM1222398.1 GSCFA domain-containing protein [Ponticoccus sp. SC6-9]MBM1224511.1 GSCFA domain-containing protein [Ponticoccus sp. SC6-15]MBM1229709.1 GSCFA domain-containing protein [Ponticoccus sp. SC6-38]MBM1233477.1 GSCFA domain-containing protein [Ponticoccus sp. SC6-45]MBM1236573.1 GSCFA domain-containing protein [Ponticoccus sp. SC6-49]MBM1244617.1 GSCFA domain-containing protein [Ponticoccus sp. SC2-64]MBM1247001.1 GSCFA domai